MSKPQAAPALDHNALSPQSSGHLSDAEPRPSARVDSFHPQLPVSPPLSSAASYVDASTLNSPRQSALTPPMSAPMSAQPSQTSISGLPGHPNDHSQIHLGSQSTTLGHDPSTTIDALTPITKRKLEHDELEDSLAKRRKFDSELDRPRLSPGPKPTGLTSLYKVQSAPHPTLQPHMTDNLVSLYGLDGIATASARFHPITNEKQKVRKHFEYKLQDLPGKHKATPTPGDLMGLLEYPDEEWHIQRVMNKGLDQGLSEQMMAKLGKAVNMGAGQLPQAEHDRWRDVISFEPALKANPPQQNSINTGVPAARQNADISPTESLRPSRRGTKRRYNDDTFEGYGEGYVDDMGDAGSIDDGDGGGGTLKKKRRRVGLPRKAKPKERR